MLVYKSTYFYKYYIEELNKNYMYNKQTSNIHRRSYITYPRLFGFQLGEILLWRSGGLTVSVLLSSLSGLCCIPGWEHCIVVLGKTLYSHSSSLHPSV